MKGLDEFDMPRPWKLPSFDPPPPPPPPPPSWKQEEIDAAFDAARLAGHAEGLAQGTEQGLAEGLARGLSEGREAGHHEAFDAAEAKLEKLAASLKLLIDEMAEFPDAIAAPVVDLALLIAQRLTGNASFERAAFVQAVQEALQQACHPPLQQVPFYSTQQCQWFPLPSADHSRRREVQEWRMPPESTLSSWCIYISLSLR